MTILSTRVDNTQDTIDSRDIIERLEELRSDDYLSCEELEELHALNHWQPKPNPHQIGNMERR